MANADLVKDLKALVEFIEKNDDFDFTRGSDVPVTMKFMTWYLYNEQDKRAVVADLARRLGHVDKRYSNEFIWLNHAFGKTVDFQVSSQRHEICERVVVGTKIVPAHGEIIIPAAPEHEEEIVEWKCSPILEATHGA